MKKLIMLVAIFSMMLLSVNAFARNHGGHHNSHHGYSNHRHGYHRSHGSHRYRTQLDDVMATAYAVNTLGQMFLPRVQVAPQVPIALPVVPAHPAPAYYPSLPPGYEICYQNGREYIRYWKCGQYYYIPNYGPHRHVYRIETY